MRPRHRRRLPLRLGRSRAHEYALTVPPGGAAAAGALDGCAALAPSGLLGAGARAERAACASVAASADVAVLLTPPFLVHSLARCVAVLLSACACAAWRGGAARRTLVRAAAVALAQVAVLPTRPRPWRGLQLPAIAITLGQRARIQFCHLWSLLSVPTQLHLLSTSLLEYVLLTSPPLVIPLLAVHFLPSCPTVRTATAHFRFYPGSRVR